MAATTYTCSGSVRGDCGTKHRTIAAAARCVSRDQEGCASQGGYSDREVMRVEGVRAGGRLILERLTEVEADELDAEGAVAVARYPREVAQEVAARRPDLCADDAVAAVLTADPTLTAAEVIDLLDEAAAEHAREAGR